jgi:hypothetical protein
MMYGLCTTTTNNKIRRGGGRVFEAKNLLQQQKNAIFAVSSF